MTHYNDQPNDGAVGSIAVYNPSGGWDLCSSGDDGWRSEMTPGQNLTAAVWMFLPLKTHAHPTVTKTDRQSLAIGITALANPRRAAD